LTPPVSTHPQADLIANYGLELALDLTYDLTVNFTGAYFYEELQGMADCGNVSYDLLKRIHLLGALTQGDCSMFGAWGPATASTGKTLQLRALDWNTDGPFKDYPAVQVYHPSTGNDFAIAGFVGWIGALTGQSSQQMAIS
jgi:isopenicillin-N N-acyltransferase like protein